MKLVRTSISNHATMRDFVEGRGWCFETRPIGIVGANQTAFSSTRPAIASSLRKSSFVTAVRPTINYSTFIARWCDVCFQHGMFPALKSVGGLIQRPPRPRLRGCVKTHSMR